MKKNLFLIALLFATSMWATQTVLAPGSNQLVAAINNAAAGDTIVFQTGTYTEAASTSPTLPAKKITLMAADGATPTLVTYSMKINADFEINGINLVNASKDSYLLRTGGNVDGTIAIKNCSFKLNDAVTNPVGYIYLSSNSVGSLLIDNCIFSDNADTNGAILRAQSAKIGQFSMTNCTAYNMPVDHAIFCEGISSGYVDHCTFYNCGVRTVYMKGETMTNYLVQNCIFMNPSVPESNNYCVATYSGDVKNCMYYNVNAPRSSNATVTGCQKADPLFVDAANANFQLMANSPAVNFGTDGQTIGDPRWGVAARDPKIEVEPGTGKIAAAVAAAQAGDTLVLSTGEYIEESTITIDKKITFLAAEDAKPEVAITGINIADEFEANGITFSNNSNSANMFIPNADIVGTIAFKNCAFSNQAATPYIVMGSNSLGNLIIDNCIFSGSTKAEGAVVYATSTPISNFTLTNSTITNCAGELTFYMGGVSSCYVDHCTFYNCNKRVLYITGGSNYLVQNCVVSNAETPASNNYCMSIYGGYVNNIVYKNTKAPRSGSTNTGCVEADPQFVDAANGDFNFPVTSPLFLAATDGTHIGDPRWTAQIGAGIDLPAVLNKANVSTTHPDMTYYGDSQDYFDFGPDGSKDYSARWAGWIVNIEKGKYKVTAEAVVPSGGYQLQVEIINPTTGEVVCTKVAPYGKDSIGELDLNSLAVGQYFIRFKNITTWSQVKARNLTFTQKGGKVVDVPTTLVGDEDYVMLSQYAVIKNDSILFADDDHSWKVSEGWAKWNIKVDEKAKYSFTANARVPEGIAGNGWNYKVSIIDGTDTIYSKSKYGESNVDEAVDLGSCVLEPGTYTLQMQNIQNYSKGRLLSVEVEKVLTAYPRTIAAGRWGTICYPNQIQAIERATLYEPVDKSETALTVDPVSLTDVVAGKAYFFYAEEADPVFYYNDQIIPAGDSIENNGLIGTFTGIELSEQKWVLTNNVIKPAAVGSTVGAYRAYIDLEKVEKTSAPARAGRKVFTIADTPTELENVNANVNANRKLLINGQFVIMKDGKMFNAQGAAL